MGLIMAAGSLAEVFDERHYRHLNGGILEAFGILFSRDLKIYLYPWKDEQTGAIMDTTTLPIHPRLKPLYDYLIHNKKVVDLEDYDPALLSIFSKDALSRIKAGDSGWENLVPDFVDTVIKEKCLFGYCGLPASLDPDRVDDPAEAAAKAIGGKS
jgi:hypothetical protein